MNYVRIGESEESMSCVQYHRCTPCQLTSLDHSQIVRVIAGGLHTVALSAACQVSSVYVSKPVAAKMDRNHFVFIPVVTIIMIAGIK